MSTTAGAGPPPSPDIRRGGDELEIDVRSVSSARGGMNAGDPTSRRDVGMWEWGAISLAMIALQIEWAAEYVYLTPSLLQAGVSPSLAAAAWLPSPVLQLIISPKLGKMSDDCVASRRRKGCRCCRKRGGRRGGAAGGGGGAEGYGTVDDDDDAAPPTSGIAFWVCATRRHPFLFATGAVALCMMVLLVLAHQIADLIGINNGGGPAWGRIIVLEVGFVLLDASNSINEEFQRSLITDIAPTPHERTKGHSFLAGAVGFGGAIGYIMGSINWENISPLSGMATLFAIAAILFTIFQALMLLKSARLVEQLRQWRLKGGDVRIAVGGDVGAAPLLADSRDTAGPATTAPHGSTEASVSTPEQDHSVLHILRNSTREFRLMCVQQVFAWLGLWPIWMFASAYFGSEVFNGDPNAPQGSQALANYNDGVRAGALGVAGMGIASTFVGVLLPSLERKLGTIPAYVVLQSIGSTSTALLMFVRSRWLSSILLLTSGVMWASNNSLPFTLLKKVCRPDEIALHTNVLYLAQTLPQLLAAITIGPVVTKLAGDFGAGMLIAGCCGFAAIGTAVAWWPRTTKMPGSD